MFKISCTSINAHLGTSDHGLSLSFKDPGAVANGFTGIKISSMKCPLHFQLELSTLGFLTVPTNKNLKE